MLQVTPNGGLDRAAHPSVPISVEELLADVRACVTAGADGVHLHPRDETGRESLDPAYVNDTVAQVRGSTRRLGLSVEVGVTTGAWIEPDLDRRTRMIRQWEGVDCATVNLCEPGFEHVMASMLDVGIGIDAAVWAPTEVDLLVRSGLLPRVQRISIELGPGGPHHLSGDPSDVAGEVNRLLDEAGSTCPRLTHGEGAWTWPLVRDAYARGHDTRVGFEDSTLLPDGTTAGSNVELVRAAMAMANR